MIPESHRKEDLNQAYVGAVAARAGLFVAWPNRDYGVDGTLHEAKEGPRGVRDTGRRLDFQLKASKNWRADGSEIVYNFDVDNYNDIVDRLAKPGTVPLALFLLCLPITDDQWIHQDETQLAIRRCCYWYSGVDGIEESKNKSSVTIYVPRKQILTPEAMTSLLA